MNTETVDKQDPDSLLARLVVSEYEKQRDEVNRRIDLQNASVRYMLLAGGAIFGVLATVAKDSKMGISGLCASPHNSLALLLLWGFTFLAELIIANSMYQLAVMFCIDNYQRAKISELVQMSKHPRIYPSWLNGSPWDYLVGVPKIGRTLVIFLQTLILHAGALVGLIGYFFVWRNSEMSSPKPLWALILLAIAWLVLLIFHAILVLRYRRINLDLLDLRASPKKVAGHGKTGRKPG